MRVLIVDDHRLFSSGLKMLLFQATGAGDVVCCETGEEALDLAAAGAHDLVLLDWNLGNALSGEALIRKLREALPDARIVIVSGEATPERVKAAVDCGAVGFVPKDSSPALLVDALSVTAHGGIYLPMAALSAGDGSAHGASASSVAEMKQLRSIEQAFPALTARHVDVLQLLVRGLSNKLIARQLVISENTVKQHLASIFRHLEVQSRTEAVYLLSRRGVRLG